MIPSFDMGDRLAKARKLAGMNQHEMARWLGCDRRTVANYEGGHTHPPAAVVAVWSQLTGVELEWLDPHHPLLDRVPGHPRDYVT